MIEELKYRAFLSYSHEDAKWAKWLHRKIEGYRIPKDLISRDSARGKVPSKLRPIFYDRAELPASASLQQSIVEALDQSEFLIVICSPNATASSYVNEEVKYFKSLGRSDCILALIIDGEPGDPELECFPPALRFKMAPDDHISFEPEEPLAADARQHRDGRAIALLKLIASLLGVGLDEIRKRDAIVQRRRIMILGGVSAMMAILTITAIFAAWLAEQRRTEAERNLSVAKDAANVLVYDLAQGRVLPISLRDPELHR